MTLMKILSRLGRLPTGPLQNVSIRNIDQNTSVKICPSISQLFLSTSDNFFKIFYLFLCRAQISKDTHRKHQHIDDNVECDFNFYISTHIYVKEIEFMRNWSVRFLLNKMTVLSYIVFRKNYTMVCSIPQNYIL